MKAIWQRELYSIVKDSSDGVYLSSVELENEDELLYVDYSEPGLIIDPTDSDIEEMSIDNDYI